MTSLLATRAARLKTSAILAIAADVREQRASGCPVVDFTVGDFDAKQFTLPDEFNAHVGDALRDGHTTYPPLAGVESLREAITRHTRKQFGVDASSNSIVVASGARPLLFAAYQCLVNPGDSVAYAVPSWSNEEFATLASANVIGLPTTADNDFQPSVTQVLEALPGLRLLCITSPLNPSGTLISAPVLEEILRNVVAENRKRVARSERPIFVLFDQVYSGLVFGSNEHAHPLRLVPEAEDWVIAVDAVTKNLAATGLRVGWAQVPSVLRKSIMDIVCHIGGWAPTPFQVAIARFYDSGGAVAHMEKVRDEIAARSAALIDGLAAIRSTGVPIEFVEPDGGLFASIRLPWIGRKLGGHVLESDECTRRVLLEMANLALVPFSAFGTDCHSGWFRAALGMTTVSEVSSAMERLASLAAELE